MKNTIYHYCYVERNKKIIMYTVTYEKMYFYAIIAPYKAQEVVQNVQ